MAMSDDGRCELLWLQGPSADAITVKAASLSIGGAASSGIERVGDANLDENGDSARWPGDYISIATRGSTRYAVWTSSQEGYSRVLFSQAYLP